MLKYFTFVIFLFSIEVSFAQDLTAILKMPEVVAPGEDYIAEVTITKGPINSYIKFSQKLPPHFKATEIELRGGKFTFDDSIITIVWFFPPADSEFTFSYNVHVSKDASGVKKIGGKIFYFFNTNREVFSFEKKNITIGTAKDILAAKEKIKNDSILAHNIFTKPVESTITNTLVITKTDTTVTHITTTSQTKNEIIKIEQTKDIIVKSTTDSIIKVVSTKDTTAIPITKVISKAVAKKDTASTLIVKVVNKAAPIKDTLVAPIAKAISKVAPKKDTTVAPMVKAVSKVAPKKDTVSAPIVKAVSKGVPKKDTVSAPIVKVVSKLALKKDTTVAPIIKAVSKALSKKDTTVIPITKAISKIVPKKDTTGNLSYCVQLGTFKEEVPLELANKFFKISARGIKNFKDNNGFTTFTVGNFKTHDEAISLKNEMLEKGFKGAFIVAFPTNKNSHSSTIKKTAETIVNNKTATETITKIETKTQTQNIPIAIKTEKVVENSNVSIKSISSSANRSYRVQLGAFKEEVPLAVANKFLKVSAKGIKILKDDRGFTVYTVGNCSSHEEAVVLKNEMIEKGFQGAFIVTFENGKPLTPKGE